MIIKNPHLYSYRSYTCKVSRFEQNWVKLLGNELLEKQELGITTKENTLLVAVYYQYDFPKYLHRQIGSLNYFVEVESWMIEIWKSKKDSEISYVKPKYVNNNNVKTEQIHNYISDNYLKTNRINSKKFKECEVCSIEYVDENYLLNLIHKRNLD